MSPTKKIERNTGQVLFELKKKVAPPKIVASKKKLEDYEVIKPGTGEKILCVQRRHKIALIKSIFQQIFIVLSLLVLIFFISHFLQQTFFINFEGWIIITYLMLSFISIFSVVMIYIFMSWYYEFYIITNRSILHRYCFRIAGPFSEIVYGERMHVREINRIPPNLICDFLKIEDVYVHFQKVERDEPFIFSIPENAQMIEDILHDLAIIKNHPKNKYD